jgi:thiamine transport system ATP-binding protein
MLHRDLKATIVLVTHEPREAASLADRVAFLDEGRIAYLGPPGGADLETLFSASPRPAI